ncbi:uncharacterized protein LOC121404956 isoform X2 [Drosophila obscura]|uniref:uncharacterized protein LOC121404956 isoform X2 n=1 Tax=Drosophila obscura TaxID=7282 RepID=UPI001BB11D45|nr:uncharacterized protein LOC121404956 isoform X2 [Drosophila obscura]
MRIRIAHLRHDTDRRYRYTANTDVPIESGNQSSSIEDIFSCKSALEQTIHRYCVPKTSPARRWSYSVKTTTFYVYLKRTLNKDKHSGERTSKSV